MQHARGPHAQPNSAFAEIRETLNNLILKSPDEWHTQVALPFVRIVGTSVEWDECAHADTNHRITGEVATWL